MATVIDGVVIGGVGGAIAGLSVWLIQYLHDKIILQHQKTYLYKWLQENTKNEPGHDAFRSTRAIASWNNMTEDRVRYVCSIHKKIFLSTGENEDLWSIYDHERRSKYEKEGLTVL